MRLRTLLGDHPCTAALKNGSIKSDLVNAGALWEDKSVVIDRHFVSSRKPDDLPAFCSTLVEQFAVA